MSKKYTHERNNIPIEIKVTMAFTQLGNENYLQMCGKFYGIIKSTTSNLMKEFYLTIRKHLKPLVIPKLTKDKIKIITTGFESLHGIPYILGAINGSHIPIVEPKVDPKPYYYKKRFCSTLIQRIVHRCKVQFLGL